MTTDTLFDEIEFDEGCKLKAYKDSRGFWSIGIGHNLQVDPSLFPHLQHLITDGISLDQARDLFNNDAAGVLHGLDLHIPWWRNMNGARQNAVANLTFNLGVAKFMTWHHTIGFLQAEQYVSAGTEIQGTQPWASQVHERANRIGKQIATGISQYPLAH